MSRYASITPAIEEMVTDQIYRRIHWLRRNTGETEANRLITYVADWSQSVDGDTEVTPGYVSGLLWELIEAGELDIDKYGAVTVARTTV